MEVALPSSLLGACFAAIAATVLAVQYLCVRIGTRDGDVVGVVLVSLLCNVAIVVPLVLLIYPHPYTELFSPVSIVSFAIAGISGSLLARLLMFKSIETVGASRTSPVVASNVFFATVFAVVFLGEVLTPMHLVGIILIVAGIVVISWETARTSSPDVSLQEIGLSFLLPLGAAVALGIEPVFVSFGLSDGTPVLPGVAVKVTVATAGFVGYVGWHRSSLQIPIRSQSMIWYIGAGITSAIGIIFYFAALEIAPVILVVPILQTTPLFVVIFSALLLPHQLERVTPLVVGAATIVVIGTMLVSVSG